MVILKIVLRLRKIVTNALEKAQRATKSIQENIEKRNISLYC